MNTSTSHSLEAVSWGAMTPRQQLDAFLEVCEKLHTTRGERDRAKIALRSANLKLDERDRVIASLRAELAHRTAGLEVLVKDAQERDPKPETPVNHCIRCSLSPVNRSSDCANPGKPGCFYPF